MSWSMPHFNSEQYAGEAELALKRKEYDRAKILYRQAAELETQALSSIEPSKKRTRGITAVSAASLWFKAHSYDRAQDVAFQQLASRDLPSFAIEQLQNLLQMIWLEIAREESGIQFAQGEVLISVSGGEIVPGGAPLELIITKVDQVSRIFYRIIELLLHKPLRIKGAPSQEIKGQFQPWLFQAPPGSYQFAVRVQKPQQLPLFEQESVEVEKITETFLNVVKASVDDPKGKLVDLVPEEGYRDVFLKLTRNLSPSGKTFQQLEINAPTTEIQPIILRPISRVTITETLNQEKAKKGKVEEKDTVQLRGILRALHLDRDWIEIDLPEEGGKNVRIHDTGDVIDDVIGPMVNQSVVVDVVRKSDGKYSYRDIQLEE